MNVSLGQKGNDNHFSWMDKTFFEPMPGKVKDNNPYYFMTNSIAKESRMILNNSKIDPIDTFMI